jgi:hypothetical protein
VSSKISGYSAITSVQVDDLLPVVDVHDTTMAPSGTTKKATLSQLPFDAAGAAAAAQAAAIAASLPSTDDLSAIATANATAANVPMNGKKLTGLANGSAAADSAAYGQTPAGGNTAVIGQGGTGQTTAAAAYNALSPMTTKGDMEYDSAAGVAARLAVGSAGQVLGVSGGVPAWGAGMTLLATTGLSGFALVNGTPTIISWTAPNDGQLHRVEVFASVLVTSTETGGILRVTWMGPGASTAQATQLLGASNAASTASYAPNASMTFTIQPNTTVSVVQGSALTVGSATAYAEIWGS